MKSKYNLFTSDGYLETHAGHIVLGITLAVITALSFVPGISAGLLAAWSGLLAAWVMVAGSWVVFTFGELR